jgi:hypothetical protein
MSFKLKAAVAAIALTASVSANAAVVNTVSGDSSMILTLLDNTNNISATFNLGYTHSSFDRNISRYWNVATSYAATWNSFWQVAQPGFVQYAVFSADSLGTAVGAQSLFTTLSASSWATTSNQAFTNALRLFDSYMDAVNTAQGASNSNIAISGSAFAEFSSAYGTSGKIANVGSDANALLGTKMSAWLISRSHATNNLTAATASKLTPTFVENGQTVNPYFVMTQAGRLDYVAAVPEADSWAMLLAGLGMMGFIARRRMAA